MKPCKEGYEIAKELSKIDLSKIVCKQKCYNCLFWNDYCMANMIKNIIQKSNRYIENHKE